MVPIIGSLLVLPCVLPVSPASGANHAAYIASPSSSIAADGPVCSGAGFSNGSLSSSVLSLG